MSFYKIACEIHPPGEGKAKTERYLIQGDSLSYGIERTYKYLAKSGQFEGMNIAKTRIMDVLSAHFTGLSEEELLDADYYEVIVAFNIEGSNKKTREYYLVETLSTAKAEEAIKDYHSDAVNDYAIVSNKKVRYHDVILLEDEDKIRATIEVPAMDD